MNLVVGAGLAGATIAYLIAEYKQEPVLVIDQREHLAGNCYDFRDKTGITVHKYGSHIFHTNNQKIWNFLEKFTVFNTYQHQVLGLIEGQEVPIPFNLNTLYQLFPPQLARELEIDLLSKFVYQTKVSILEFKKMMEPNLKFLANYIFKQFFLNYSRKQWGDDWEKLDSSVISRVPVYLSRDSRYFQDVYQGIPLLGYTELVKKMLSHPRIKFELNCPYAKVAKVKFERTFYTGSIDEFFNYQLGVLPYRSLIFKGEKHLLDHYQNNAVINYPNNYDFTRIHEYKYYLREKSPYTVIAKEYPKTYNLGENEPYYPILNITNCEMYKAYLARAKELPNLYFLGRLGDYRYYNMDQTIVRAFEVFRGLT